MAPGIEADVLTANADIESTELEVSALPGSAARCPNCRSQMRMQRIKDGRNWWTMWVCARCREMYRPANFPEAARAAGWKR